MKQITIRLKPKEDLKQSILIVAKKFHVKAGVVVSSVGSLTKVMLRLSVIKGKPIYKEISGDFEILSLNGTIANNGSGCHLHMSVSDKEGKVHGGHLMEGCTIKTTVELVILVFNDTVYTRAIDLKTGFQELNF